MKPIKLYFAGSAYPFPLENRLVSYAYPTQLKEWFDRTKGLSGNIIVDSGAFSAWRSGKVIDIDDYISYAHAALVEGKKQGKVIKIVNLDVIPGKVGQTTELNKILSGKRVENLALINQAARQGYLNMRKMIDGGIDPIHVFHQGEEWKWLDRMVENVSYIGISPANDSSNVTKRRWMNSVFTYLYKNNIDVDTHGFAVFDQSIIKEFPWTSCDATSPLLLAGYGKVICPVGGFTNPDYSQKPGHLVVSEKRAVDGRGDVSPEKLKQLLGMSFKELQVRENRVKLNVQFVLGLQEFVNKKKEKTEFKPRVTLL